MASAISATSANGSSYDTAAVDNTGTSATSADALTTDFDSKALEGKLETAAAEGGVEGLVKAFATIFTDLIGKVAKMFEKFEKAFTQSDKTQTSAQKKAAKAKAAAAKKQKGAAVKQTDPAKQKKAAETQSTTSKTTTTPTEASNPATPATPSTPATPATPATPTTPSTPSTPSTPATPAQPIDPEEGYSDENLSVATDLAGAPEIYTADGYVLRFEGKDMAWTITDPLGKINRIWGDPHVVESDGDTWDFKDRSTFLFGDNKVTVETVPFGNGQTLSSKVTVYNGNSRVTVSGVDQNKPIFEAIRNDGELDDSLRDDGDVFVLGKEDNGEDRFILIKDTGEKFDPAFGNQVGLNDPKAKEKYLTPEQIKMLGA